MKSWDEEFNATWLSDSDFVGSYDAWTRNHLVSHRAAVVTPALESVAVWSVALLVDELREQGKRQSWPWATLTIGLLAELIFCAEGGGTKPSRNVCDGQDLERSVEWLRIMRNAAVHPAHQRGGESGPPPIEELLRVTEHYDDDALQKARMRLIVDWSSFAERPFTSFGLRLLDSAGRQYGELLGFTSVAKSGPVGRRKRRR